jgi:hypothetical protein
VRGRGSSGGGQDVDEQQIVECKRSCKRASTNTGVHFVSIVYDRVPGLDSRGSRRRMAPPSPRDTALDGGSYVWYLRRLRGVVIPKDARLS